MWLGVRLWLWVALTLAALFLVAVNLGAMVAAADHHAGLAAWVQAIGSVLAIAFATLAPYVHDNWKRQLAMAERKRQLRAAVFEVLSLADSVKSIYQTPTHMEEFLPRARLPERIEVLQEALDRAPWADMGDHTVFSLGQRLKAALQELMGHYEQSFWSDPRGVKFVSSNSRIPAIVGDCADRLKADAESVVGLIGARV